MRRILVAALAAIAIGGLPAAAPARSSDAPRAVITKTCSAGYKHAIISGSHKCLRRGQFCARSADRQYHRYGFHCHRRDANGSYHLT
jgi:hypothetical protein